MRKQRTVIDHKTGEKIKSTGLARFGGRVIWGLSWGWCGMGCVFLGAGLVDALSSHRYVSPEWHSGQFWDLPFRWLWVLFGGFALGLVVGLVRRKGWAWDQQAHDRIARRQHQRRQRILRSNEHQDVPDTAISRAQPPGEPQPTDAALSIADDPDEPARLTVGATEDTEDNMPVSR